MINFHQGNTIDIMKALVGSFDAIITNMFLQSLIQRNGINKKYGLTVQNAFLRCKMCVKRLTQV